MSHVNILWKKQLFVSICTLLQMHLFVCSIEMQLGCVRHDAWRTLISAVLTPGEATAACGAPRDQPTTVRRCATPCVGRQADAHQWHGATNTANSPACCLCRRRTCMSALRLEGCSWYSRISKIPCGAAGRSCTPCSSTRLPRVREPGFRASALRPAEDRAGRAAERRLQLQGWLRAL